jgi:hypothetical protein
MITPVAFESIKHHTYTVFAVINALIVPSVYFFFPETAYRSLEEMDTIFSKVHGVGGAFTIVHQARVEPHRYGKKGELLVTIEEAHQNDEKLQAGAKGPNEVEAVPSQRAV